MANRPSMPVKTTATNSHTSQSNASVCLWTGNKVAEDARLTRDDEPRLYTLSSDGALFSWVYEHGEAPRRRKRARLDVQTPQKAAKNDKTDPEVEDGSNNEGGPNDVRKAPFSGMKQIPNPLTAGII